MNLTKVNRALHSLSAPDRVGYTAKAAKLEETFLTQCWGEGKRGELMNFP